jgi:hypothetical protein
MEFKVGDKVRINPKSRYILQGMQDGYFMNGIVISKEEYSENNIFISSITDFNVYVRWELSKKDYTTNSYRVIDLLPSIEEHRDKQLNIILDGI